jgi:hypothetical protein
MLSGEGPTDLGHWVPMAGGPQFVPGPMAWMVDKLLHRFHTGYSMLVLMPMDPDSVRYVHKAALVAATKPGPTLLRGLKFGKGTAFFTRNAEVLGLMANSLAADDGVPVIAVLFRDGDGTLAVPNSLWQQKVDSIRRGFELVDCKTGVPMVPRPKSEAWMLCALAPPAYTNCTPLEDAPGNDNSPNALKGRLAAHNGGIDPTAEEQAAWVETGAVDPEQINMPSFDAFRNDLHAAAQNAGLQRIP